MLRRTALFTLAAAVFAADASPQGTWLWERRLYTNGSAPPGVKLTRFVFKREGNSWTGYTYITSIRRMDHLVVNGNKVSFSTGEKGGGGDDLPTRWEATISATKMTGTYQFEDGVKGTFEATRIYSK